MRPHSIRFPQILCATVRLALCALALEVFAGSPPPPAAKLETPFFRFGIWEPTGRCEALDKRTGVVWGGNTNLARLGEVTLQVGGKPRRVELTDCKLEKESASLVANFHPLSEQPAATLRVRMHVLPDQKTLEVGY